MARPIAFTHQGLPTRIVFGVGAIDRVADVMADEVAGQRVLLIASGSAMTPAKAVAGQLGERLAATFDRVAQHVPEALATAATEHAVAVSADTVISIGGGSATGLAKAVAAHTGIPVVAVPTTYAGSEVTPIYGITGTRKITRRDPRALPRVVVYDPALTAGLPRRPTASSGLNALAHCVEAFYAPGANPVTGMFAAEGMRRLTRALPEVVATPDDLDARADALFGAYLAGSAFAAAGSGLHHKLCHVLGGDHLLVHADVHAVLLPHVAAFHRDTAPGALRLVAEVIGTDDAPTALYDLAVALGAPTSLAALGLPTDALDGAVRRCAAAAAELAPSPAITHPRPADEPAIRALLDAAYHGRRPAAH